MPRGRGQLELRERSPHRPVPRPGGGSWVPPPCPPGAADRWAGPGRRAGGPGGVGGLPELGGWGLSPRGFAFFFFFFSAPFFFKSILFRGGARAAAEKRDTPARSEGFRTEGKEQRRVVRLPARRGHFSRASPNSPATSARPQAALRAAGPDNFGGGVQRKFAAAAAGLPPLGLGGSPPAPARSALPGDRVPPTPPP